MLGMSKANGAAERPSNGGVRPRHWAQAKAENPLARFVPFSSLVSPNDVITRGGDFLRVWRLDGVAFECADEHLIAERHEALCSLLRNLAGGPSGARRWAFDSGSTRSATARPRAAGTRPMCSAKHDQPPTPCQPAAQRHHLHATLAPSVSVTLSLRSRCHLLAGLTSTAFPNCG